MVSSVAAQELNSTTQDSTVTDWNGTTTESSSSLQGTNAQDSGDNFENESTSVDARVTSKVAIDVTPESLNYPFVDLGEQETVSNESFESVTIMNTGSEPIDKVWVNASTPQSDPFGSSDSTGFDAGNFFQINVTGSSVSKYASAMSTTDKYHYVNRKEFAFQGDDETPEFLVAPNGTEEIYLGANDANNQPDEIEKGAIRVGDKEYYYVILEDGSGGCNGASNAKLRIGNTPFTASQTGTYDFTDDGPDGSSPDWTSYDLTTTTGSYGITQSSVTLEGRTYDYLTACDDASGFDDASEHVLRTRYNVNPGSVSDLVNGAGSVTNFVFNGGDGTTEFIQPSEFITLDTAVEVPRGVTQGQLGSGTFRMFVTSDNSET